MNDPLLDTLPLPVGDTAIPTPLSNRYSIGALLGKGGMAEVYEAVDLQLDRKVALKLILAGRSELSPLLWREALVMGKLSHPNVVQVYDLGVADGRVFIAMELVEGETLDRWLAQPRTWREILAVFRDAGRGLAAAHATGIVHRDFKPANVLVGRDGRVRVADFGIAAFTKELAEPGLFSAGTPRYMAPEQRDGRADTRSDEFSLCLSLYEAWSGTHPFVDSDGKATPDSRGPADEDPRGKVPAWAWRSVVRGLALDPAKRWPSVEELIDALGRDPSIRRRRWATGAGIATVALGAGVWFAGGGSDPEATCAVAGDRIAAVWNAPVRDELVRQFTATKLAYAPDTARLATAAIDGAASDWRAMRVEACRATRVRGEQSDELLDRRMACLDVRLAELGGLLSVLAAPVDTATVDGAVRAIGKLTPIDTCADTDALLSQIAAPADPGLRARVAALRDEIARVEATLQAGKRDGMREVIAPLELQATSTTWPTVIASARFLAGYERFVNGEYEAAIAKLRDAAKVAATARDDRLVARALGIIAFAHDDAGQFEKGLAVALDSEIAAARVGHDPLLEAQAYDAQGYSLASLSRYPEARTAYERAIQVYERGAADGIELGPFLNNWGSMEIDAGNLDRARSLLERALAIFRARLGPLHPFVASVLTNLGNVALYRGTLDDAERFYRESLAIKRKALTPKHPSIATVIHNLGNVALNAGRLDEAEERYHEALAFREEVLAKDHAATLETRYQLAMIDRLRGRPRESLAKYQSILEVRIAKFGENHASVGNTLDSMATSYEQLSQFDEAIALRKRALAIRQKVLGAENADVAETIGALASALAQNGDCAAATDEAKRSLAMFDHTRERTFYGRAEPLAVLAACAARHGDRAGAIAQYRDAAPLLVEHPQSLAVLELEQANVMWELGTDRPAAIALATGARARVRTTDLVFARIDAWLRAHQ